MNKETIIFKISTLLLNISESLLERFSEEFADIQNDFGYAIDECWIYWQTNKIADNVFENLVSYVDPDPEVHPKRRADYIGYYQANQSPRIEYEIIKFVSFSIGFTLNSMKKSESEVIQYCDFGSIDEIAEEAHSHSLVNSEIMSYILKQSAPMVPKARWAQKYLST